jgi:PKD repeat protein
MWTYDTSVWDFYNATANQTSTAENVTLDTHSMVGLYNLLHKVNNTYGGNETTKIAYLNILAPGGGGPVAPVAAFSCTPIAGVRNATRTCTDTSTNTPTGWDWYGFGPNPCFTGNVTNQNPLIFPKNFGYCSLGLIATNAGGSDTESKGNYIYVSQPQVVI